jgi:excisionase family DNA binding protein
MTNTRVADRSTSWPRHPPAAPGRRRHLDREALPVPLTVESLEEQGRTHVSVREAAEVLEMALRTVYNLVERGDLPHRRIGPRVQVPVDALRRIVHGTDLPQWAKDALAEYEASRSRPTAGVISHVMVGAVVETAGRRRADLVKEGVLDRAGVDRPPNDSEPHHPSEMYLPREALVAKHAAEREAKATARVALPPRDPRSGQPLSVAPSTPPPAPAGSLEADQAQAEAQATVARAGRSADPEAAAEAARILRDHGRLNTKETPYDHQPAAEGPP